MAHDEIVMAPPCEICGRMYVDGDDGVCKACLKDRGAGMRHRRRPHVRLRCDCGRPAVAVILVRLGYPLAYPERLALCARCLKLEKEMRKTMAER